MCLESVVVVVAGEEMTSQYFDQRHNAPDTHTHWSAAGDHCYMGVKREASLCLEL